MPPPARIAGWIRLASPSLRCSLRVPHGVAPHFRKTWGRRCIPAMLLGKEAFFRDCLYCGEPACLSRGVSLVMVLVEHDYGSSRGMDKHFFYIRRLQARDLASTFAGDQGTEPHVHRNVVMVKLWRGVSSSRLFTCFPAALGRRGERASFCYLTRILPVGAFLWPLVYDACYAAGALAALESPWRLPCRVTLSGLTGRPAESRSE